MARLVSLQNQWKRGMKRDIPRVAMPDGSAYSIVDYIPDLDAPLTKRGGWAYGSNAMGAATTQGLALNKLAEKAFLSASSYTTTNTLTPSVNKLYLAAVASKADSGTPNTPTMTGGGGLTWVQVATLQVPTSRPWRLTLFRALKTSGLTSGTLTIDFGGQTTTRVFIEVTEVANVNTGGTNGSSAVVQSATGSAASGTTATATLAAFADTTNNIAFGATLVDSSTVTAVTPESGYTELSDTGTSGQGTLETEWKIGQDTSVTSTWSTSSNWAMIGAEISVSISSVTPNYVNTVFYAPFAGNPRLCVISDTGVLGTVDTNTLAVTSVGVTNTTRQPTFHADRLIIPSQTGLETPYKFDGVTLALLTGAPTGKYATTYRDRTVIANTAANPTYVYFSNAGDPTTWDTTNSWISVNQPVTGLGALPGALMVFQAQQTTRIRGSTPPPETDMVADDPVFNIGCTDARSIATTSSLCAFASPTGVYITNGTNLPTDLTQAAGIKRYWQSILTSYDSSSWTLAGGFYQNNYLITVMNGSTFVDAFLFNLEKYSVVRVSNFTAVSFTNATQISEELWFGLRDEAKLGRFSTVFSPSATYKNDADGTAVTPTIETPMYGTDPAGSKSWRSVYVEFDIRDAATDNPILTVSTAKQPDGAYTALSPTLAESTDRTRKRLAVRFNNDGLGLKIAQSNASSLTRIYAIQADVHAREQSRV